MHAPTAIVITEFGTSFTPFLGEAREGDCEVVVVEQTQGESFAELARRVRDQVSELMAAGAQVARAVLVGSGRTDVDTLSGRSSMVRSLISPMVSANRGELVLVSRGRDRYSMQGLATMTTELLRGTGVVVRAAESATGAKFAAA